MQRWEVGFGRNVLEQGGDLLKMGRVSELKEEEGKCTASVWDRHIYQVKILSKNSGDGWLMSCQCPMARGGGKCKHMAAVMYAREQAIQGAVEKDAGPAKPRDGRKGKTKEPVSQELHIVQEEDGQQVLKLSEGRESLPGKEAFPGKGVSSGHKEEIAESLEREDPILEEPGWIWEPGQEEEMPGIPKGTELLGVPGIFEVPDSAGIQDIPGESGPGPVADVACGPHYLSEDEYIVLNGQEEPEPSQETDGGRQRLAGEELATYQYFDCEAVGKSMRLTVAVMRKGNKLLEEGKVSFDHIESGYVDDRMEVICEAIGEGREGKEAFPIHLVFDRTQVLFAECGCTECRRHYYYGYYRREYCAYLSAFFSLVEQKVKEGNMGDATDKLAMFLMSAYTAQRTSGFLSDNTGKKESLTLVPKLIRRNHELIVSFRVGEGKLFVIKDLAEFWDNVRQGKTAVYGSSTPISHHSSNFKESSKKWLDFIGRVTKEEQDFERRLEAAGAYRRTGARKSELALSGWRLDELYQLMGEDVLEYEDRDADRKRKGQVQARSQNPRVSIAIRKNALSTRREFHGITVTCRMPSFFYGARTAYYVQENALCRLEEDFLARIRTLADFCQGGKLEFTVGRNSLAHFYYNVLPQLEDVIDIMEEDTEEIASYLPPRVRFVFYLDAGNQNMNCRVKSMYGDKEFSLFDLLDENLPYDRIRDVAKEGEILYLVKKWFPHFEEEKQELDCGGDEELMYQVLNGGVELLMSLGEVRCTRRFTNVNINRRLKMSVGVSVSRDLLDLHIETQDIPPEELLDILKGYRQRKKYYRLKNGDFLSLEDNTLATLEEMMAVLRLSPKELLKGDVKLPLYRAMYLDKLLEKNEEIYSNRDSHFREIVKDFKTVKDADFEVPPSLREVMRGYQRTGYRFLRTLEEYRLGGILADDMGLGKTLQVIAVFLAARLEGKVRTSLVVAPASLVYNWGEEIGRFAPELTFLLVTGSQEERLEKLEQYRNFDVVVTSYDLLKRDIAHYEDKEFHYHVIDEAQYIKNHTTAAAAAVKGVRSHVRYALTGTPIENRLSELWSIFDFLIPGYLFGYDVFRNEFESPIVKNEDQAALERLQRMTVPFILRRMKQNVLKDLPEKMEESRYVKFESSQQQLYDAQVIHMKQKIAMQDAQEFQKNKMQILAELTKLRQICCDPVLCFENYKGGSAKLEACMDLVCSAVEGGHKILLFSQFTSMLELVAKRMDQEKISFYTITGATPKEKRLQFVKAFNEDDTRVFLISLKAGGVGLNLTGADVVIHYDPWWNLAVQNQATDRAHRIGQEKRVVVYKLIAKGTIEEKIQKLQESKRVLSEQVIQGEAGQLAAMSREDFMALLS